MKTENLTHGEAVQAMMGGDTVIGLGGCEYIIDSDRIATLPFTCDVSHRSFFDKSNEFRVKQIEPKKVKKTFYRARYMSPCGENIYEAPWFPTMDAAKDDVGGAVLIEIETRDFMVPE